MAEQTKKEYFNRLVNIHHEVETLNEDVKAIKEEFEESFPDASFADFNRVAKLKATCKLGQAVTKAEVFLELAEEITSDD